MALRSRWRLASDDDECGGGPPSSPRESARHETANNVIGGVNSVARIIQALGTELGAETQAMNIYQGANFVITGGTGGSGITSDDIFAIMTNLGF